MIPEALDGHPGRARLRTLPGAHGWRTAWSRLGWPPAERWLGAFDVLHFTDWMYPPQRAGRARDDDPRPRAAALPRVGAPPRTRAMHGAQVRERGAHLRRHVRQLARSPPTTSPRRSAFPRERDRRRASRASAPSSRPTARRPTSAVPYAAHRRDARAAQEPRHARRGVRAARRPELALAVVGGAGWGEQPRARPAGRRPARPRLRRRARAPLPRRRGGRLPVALRGLRDADHRGDGVAARRSSPRRTRRSTRPAATRPCAPTRRAPRRSRRRSATRSTRRDELAREGPRARGAVLVGADRRALPRGVPAIRVAHRHDAARSRRAPARRATCAGCSTTSTCRCSELVVPGDVAACARVAADALWYPRLRADGRRRAALPDLPRPVPRRRCRSSSPCTTSPCCGTRSGSTAGRAPTRASPCRASCAPRRA